MILSQCYLQGHQSSYRHLLRTSSLLDPTSIDIWVFAAAFQTQPESTTTFRRQVKSLTLLLGITSNHLDIVAGKNAFSIAYPSCPPVRRVLCTLDNSDDLALLKSQIARLIGLKGELGNRLARGC